MILAESTGGFYSCAANLSDCKFRCVSDGVWIWEVFCKHTVQVYGILLNR
jgi:hypothetical protein